MNVYIDDQSMIRLRLAAKETGRTVEDLAASAVEEAALDWAKKNIAQLPVNDSIAQRQTIDV